MFGMLGLRLNSDLIAKVVTWTTATALRANESCTRPNAYVRYTTILRCSSGLTDTTRQRCIFQKLCVKTELVQELRLLENTHSYQHPSFRYSASRVARLSYSRNSFRGFPSWP
jgi:hypothetical protein